MKKLISMFAFIAICTSFVSAAMPATGMSDMTGYIKGFVYAQSGDVWIVIDKTKPFNYTASTNTLGNQTYTSWYFFLGNVNSTSTPTGATVKALISVLELSKALNERWYFSIGSAANTTNNTSNWIIGGQVEVQ